jgi:hypothetical protein
MAEDEDSMVAVGYPKGEKYQSYRGNGERMITCGRFNGLSQDGAGTWHAILSGAITLWQLL